MVIMWRGKDTLTSTATCNGSKKPAATGPLAERKPSASSEMLEQDEDAAVASGAAAVAIEQSEDSSSNDDENDDDNHDSSVYTRPIVVGYAFGPKKMSTMGRVMAEASRTKLSTTTTIIGGQMMSIHVEEDEEFDDDDNNNNNGDTVNGAQKHQAAATTTTTMPSSSSTAVEFKQSNDALMDANNNATDGAVIELQQQHSVVFTIADGVATPANHDNAVGLRNIVRYFQSSCSSVASGGDDNSGNNNNNNIGDDWSASTGTCTASTITSQLTTKTGGTATTASSSLHNGTLSNCSSSNSNNTSASPLQQQHPIRVSFVPLDLDVALEEQHGGKLDIILHKLTEDILCLSQMAASTTAASTAATKITTRTDNNSLLLPSQNRSEEQTAAARRVARLCEFQKKHPSCCLVDDPLAVQTVMSRSEIARTLEECLSSLTSASGIPVRSPKSIVVTWPPPPPLAQQQQQQQRDANEKEGDQSSCQPWIACQIKEAGLTFPMIVKPLTAAGTKASHSMAVLLTDDALDEIAASKSHQNSTRHSTNKHGDKAAPTSGEADDDTSTSSSCLLQEYVNHDSLLYKVYVLGDRVSVHKRRSLPNLPCGSALPSSSDPATAIGSSPEETATRTTAHQAVTFAQNMVEFDSQRPYPRLSDFGVVWPNCRATAATLVENHPSKQPIIAESTTSTMNNKAATTPVPLPPPTKLAVTAEEVQPIAAALKQAFGLELFGFDIIIASGNSISPAAKNKPYGHDEENTTEPSSRRRQERTMMVVDVNYFPSYKEVPNFPALLARYLTDRAIESRRNMSQTRAMTGSIPMNSSC